MKFLSVIFSVFLIILALIYGQSIILPLLSALLLWVFVRGTKALLDRNAFLKKHIPSWVKTTFSGILIIALIGMASMVISSSVENLSRSFPSYQKNIDVVTQQINNQLNIDIADILDKNAKDLDYQSILTNIFNALTDLLGNAFMIIIFALFLFLEERNFKIKMDLLFPKQEQLEKVNAVLHKIERAVRHYLGLKTFVSLITGVLSYIALYFIGIDSPIFWAFLIFILNYIPTIGSLIATLFPAIFCILQFGDVSNGLIVLLIVGGIQVMVGNIIEPRFMGNSLNISPLVAIIALSLWGILWGVTGMILSTPITVIMVLIFSQFPQTRKAAILLSEKGRLMK